MMQREAFARVTTAANIILAGGGVVCLLALLYFLYHYGWTGERQFTSSIGPVVCYVVPALFSVLLFSNLRLLPPLKVNLALVLFSLALSVYAAEGVLGFIKRTSFGPERTLWTPRTQQDLDEIVRVAKRFGVDYDTRSSLEVMRDLQADGFHAVPAIFPNNLFVPQEDGTVKSRITIYGTEVVVLGGMSNRLTVFCNELGEWVTYQSDEYGFHNPPGIWTGHTIDVVVLGDSYAQGACVPSDQNFAAVIRKRYPATLNLGMSSEGPLMTLAVLKEYAEKFKPKAVLWFLFEENDFSDLRRESNSPLLMRYLDGHFSQGLLRLRAEIDQALEDYVADQMKTAQSGLPEKSSSWRAINAFIRLSNLRQRVGLIYGASDTSSNHGVVSKHTLDLLTQVFSVAKATVNAWGGKLYVVYLPGRQRYADPHTATLNETNREQVLRVARSLDLPVIDIHAAFQAQGDPLGLFPFRRRGHYNEEGYRFVGETVLQSISLGD